MSHAIRLMGLALAFHVAIYAVLIAAARLSLAGAHFSVDALLMRRNCKSRAELIEIIEDPQMSVGFMLNSIF